MDGLVSMDHRSLGERMRSEMVQRDVRVQSSESDWQENLAKREVDVQTSVSTRTSKHSKTTVKTVQTGTPGQNTKITLADKTTFVDKDNAADTSQDGSNEHPYGDEKGGTQKAVDNAGDNTTIFVYEAGGQVNGIKRDESDVGGVYDEQVTMKPGQTITSEITFSGHPTQTSYATANRPLIKPSTVIYNKQNQSLGMVVEYAAAVTMPENTSLQRMAVETSQDNAAAVWLQPQLGSGSVRIDSSELRTSGSGSDAVITYLDRTSLERLTVTESSINTAGAKASGIGVRVESSHLGSLNVANTRIISCSGDFMSGLDINLIDSSNLGDLRLERSTISLQGKRPNGLITLLRNSTMDSLAVINSTITINNTDAYANGITTDLVQSNLGSLTFTGGTISTTGSNARGLVSKLYTSSELGSLTVEDSRVSTTGDYADGLHLTFSEATLGDQAILNNKIVTKGDKAHGINLWDHLVAPPNPSFDATSLDAKNTIDVSGSDAEKIRITH